MQFIPRIEQCIYFLSVATISRLRYLGLTTARHKSKIDKLPQDRQLTVQHARKWQTTPPSREKQ